MSKEEDTQPYTPCTVGELFPKQFPEARRAPNKIENPQEATRDMGQMVWDQILEDQRNPDPVSRMLVD